MGRKIVLPLLASILILGGLGLSDAFAQQGGGPPANNGPQGGLIADLQAQIDSFFDVTTDMQSQIDSFFDVTTDIANLFEVDSFFDVFTELKSTDEGLQTDLDTETFERQSADTILQTSIDDLELAGGPQGIPGTSCTVEELLVDANSIGVTVSCGDASVDILDGADGSQGIPGTSCTVEELQDDVGNPIGATVSCGDASVDILDGETGPVDNLGNHMAEQNLDMKNFSIENIFDMFVDGSSSVLGDSNVAGDSTVGGNLNVGGTITGDGSGLTGVPAGPGDNLGDHTATQNLDMNSKDIQNVNNIIGTGSLTLTSGGLTVAGSSNVGGSSTVGGNLNVGGTITGDGSGITGLSAAGSWVPDSSTSSGATEFVKWDIEKINTDTSTFGFTAGADHIVIKQSGTYLVTASVLSETLLAGEGGAWRLEKNGASICTVLFVAAGARDHNSCTVITTFAANDLLQLEDLSTTNNIFGGTGVGVDDRTILSVQKLS